MKREGCKECNSFSVCELKKFLPFPQNGCSDFVKKTKKFVLVHVYCETGFKSIVAFSDSFLELQDIRDSHPRYGSSRHKFLICYNRNHPSVQYVKDICLINICNNVAEFLAVGEYAMLKKSYFKSASWFEKAKNTSSLGAEILVNY